jgi:HEAT repeat protein
MGFDAENFGIGLLAGWATAYGVYRARHLIGRTLGTLSTQASNVQNNAVRSSDKRYVGDLISLAERCHMGPGGVKLSEVAIEPRFLPPPPLPGPQEDEVLWDVFRMVPQVHDLPALHAPYNLDTLNIDELSGGSRRLALLGNPGSGRTTALMLIALRSLGVLNLRRAVDRVQQKLDAEEAALNEKQRATRIKERLMMEERAQQKLAEERGVVLNTDEKRPDEISVFNRLMPVYIHLGDVNPVDAEYGKAVDPSEPLVRAAQREVGRITSKTLPGHLYNRLNAGQVLLLVDGYDDLPESERPRRLAWLDALMQAYPDNFFIVVGPATGYGALNRIGLTPVFLRPFSDSDQTQLVDNWAEAWVNTGARRVRGAKPAPEVIERTKIKNRGLNPLELTLKIRGSFASDTEQPGMEGWMRSWVARLLPPDQTFTQVFQPLTLAAMLQLDEGTITRARLEALMGVLPSATADAPAGGATEAASESTAEATNGGKKKGEKDKEISAQGKLLNALRKTGLLIRQTGGRYSFRHAQITAYIGSLWLKEQPVEALIERSLNPAWTDAIGYLGMQAPIDAAVETRLNAPGDILHTRLFEMANWARLATGDAGWTDAYLRQVAGIMAAPSQFPLLRERAAAALVTMGDDKASSIFRQAARSQEPLMRILACLGLGALEDADAVNGLRNLAADKTIDVQLAATMALGALRSEDSLTAMIDILSEGNEQQRRLVAEMFADMPAEGYPVLYDAIQDDEMMVRRAAVFGLKRLTTKWARVAVYQSFLEDQQWYVRSAAQLAFQQQAAGPAARGPAEAQPDQIGWLQDWAASRGLNIPKGDGGIEMLLQAFQEGSTEIRIYAAGALGRLGAAHVARSLYTALRDVQPEVRESAHRALGQLQAHIGKALPAPV